MICKKCKKDIPKISLFCLHCGTKQAPSPRKTIKRENGTGSVYKRSDLKHRPWVALTPDKSRQVIGYYKTAQEAKDALDDYRRNPTTKLNITVKQLFEEWKPRGYKKISEALKYNYNSCWYKLRTIYDIKFRELRTQQIQDIIDYYDKEHQKEGTGGKLLFDESGNPIMNNKLSFSSLSKIKALLTMLYDYAMENDIINKNYAEFIVLPEKQAGVKDCFTDIELRKIENAVGKVPFADCILFMCYTGLRINEFLSVNKLSVHEINGIYALYGGIKTEAGKNKVVPLHPKIKNILFAWKSKNGQTIFCRPDGKAYADKYFREKCFYPALEEIGVRKLTPHATRRTFATRMSAANVREEDFIALMGHSNYDVDIESYIHQSAEKLYKAIEKLS